MSDPIEATAGATEPVSNISYEELIAQRMAKYTESDEASEAVEDESAELETDEINDDPIGSDDDSEVFDEALEESADEEAESDEVEPELDILSLSTEQIQELAKKGKSRLLHRIGELTAQKKALEEKINTQPAPVQTPAVKQSEIPDIIRKIDTVEGLQNKYQELEQVLETTDALLAEYEDYRADDIIDVDGQQFPKSEIRKANLNARKAITKYLPAQNAEIVRIGQRVQLEQHLTGLIAQEIPDIAKENSELGKQYRAMVNDPLVEQVRRLIPDLAPQLPYLLAHAARSLHTTQKIKSSATTAANNAKTKPSASPLGVGAARTTIKAGKDAETAYKRFEQSHSVDDWIAARTAKLR